MEGIIGLVGNILSITLSHPIDVIKTNYQVSNDSTRNIVTKIYKQYGCRGFYRGLSENLSCFPIFWFVFFQMKNYKFTSFGTITDKFMSSYVAANIGSLITCPLFVLKVRQQTSPYDNRVNIIGNIYKLNGLRGFYKGYCATTINNTKLGIQFSLYDIILNKLDVNTNINIIIASFISKTIASTLLYPFDLVRIKQRHSITPLRMLTVFSSIYCNNGLLGFYRGLLHYNYFSITNFVLMMVIIENIKKNI